MLRRLCQDAGSRRGAAHGENGRRIPPASATSPKDQLNKLTLRVPHLPLTPSDCPVAPETALPGAGRHGTDRKKACPPASAPTAVSCGRAASRPDAAPSPAYTG